MVYTKGEYRNVICESHPELCSVVMNGAVLRSKKQESDGFYERIHILSEYLGHDNTEGLWEGIRRVPTVYL